jgi:hypothetical protein
VCAIRSVGRPVPALAVASVGQDCYWPVPSIGRACASANKIYKKRLEVTEVFVGLEVYVLRLYD